MRATMHKGELRRENARQQKCESCSDAWGKETLSWNGRGLKVCGPCGRSIKERKAR